MQHPNSGMYATMNVAIIKNLDWKNILTGIIRKKHIKEICGTDSYECMHFETKQATGFQTPEYVKAELLRQFNWSQISTNITQLNVRNYGDFTQTPMVIFRFEAQYKE